MAKNRRPRKPTGTVGPVRLTVGPEGLTVHRMRVEFPNGKEEIEALIVQGFERDVKDDPSAARWIGPITRNAEDDLDFDVASSSGTRKLELTEVVPEPHSAIETEPLQFTYGTYDFARRVYEQIRKKSEHYASHEPPSTILLLYVTDWRFRLSENVLKLVSYWTAQDPHAFEFIYSYRLVSKEEGEVHLVYPMEGSWRQFDPERFRDVQETNLNPATVVHGIHTPRLGPDAGV